MDDCKRNSSLILSQCMANLDKEFEKAGLAEYSVELRRKFESSLEETFDKIEVSDASVSSQESQSRVAASISNPPSLVATPCSPFYIPFSPCYIPWSPGYKSCSPYYTPSSPFSNPYSTDYESNDFSEPTEKENVAADALSMPKRKSENNPLRNNEFKKIKSDSDYWPTENTEAEQVEQDDSVQNKNEEEKYISFLGNQGLPIDKEMLRNAKEDVG